MKMVSVLFILSFELFSYDVQTMSLIEGMRSKREIQPNEISSQDSLFENERFPLGYVEANDYSKIEPMYDMSNYQAEIMKRSLRSHNPSQRQTGIIYGAGRPIGILQPYQESFKFMPIREEQAYTMGEGRSSFGQQESYMNPMYPISRFARSEDAVRMAEEEAAKVEFLDKHYPSMLVDFKIHNKLHPSEQYARAVPDNHKREGTVNIDMNNNDQRKKKRENSSPTVAQQKLHKRENQHSQKRDTNKRTVSTATINKREEKKVEHNKRKRKTSKRQAANDPSAVDLHETKKKRQSKLTDSQFESLKKSLSKRHANGHMKFMEEDLKGLLSDMGLIENDFQGNSDEMKERKRRVIEDESSNVGFDRTSQKVMDESRIKQKRDGKILGKREGKRKTRNEETIIDKRKRENEKAILDEENAEKMKSGNENKEYNSNLKKQKKEDIVGAASRKKRKDEIYNSPLSVPLIEMGDYDLKKRTLNPDERSVSEEQDDEKRVIEVSFSNKENDGTISESDENCPKPSVIPNKREATNGELFDAEQENSISQGNKIEMKREDKTRALTTESYEQYEQRVAREIKNKIRLLKEEVKRELGALEEDKEEEDDEDSPVETQRKKRFIGNTLMDEESQNIDPNENLENFELEPHVRRRRFLSIDKMPFASQKTVNGSFGEKYFSDIDDTKNNEMIEKVLVSNAVIRKPILIKWHDYNQNQKYFQPYMGNNENNEYDTDSESGSKIQKPGSQILYDEDDRKYQKYGNQSENSVNIKQKHQQYVPNLSKNGTNFPISYIRQKRFIVSNEPFRSKNTLKFSHSIKKTKESFKHVKNNESGMDLNANIRPDQLSSFDEEINDQIIIEKGENMPIQNNALERSRLFTWRFPGKIYGISDTIDEKTGSATSINEGNSSSKERIIRKNYMNYSHYPNFNSHKQLGQNVTEHVSEVEKIKYGRRQTGDSRDENHRHRRILSFQEDSDFPELSSKKFNVLNQNENTNGNPNKNNNAEDISEIDDIVTSENEDSYNMEPLVSAILLKVADLFRINPNETSESITTPKNAETTKRLEVTNGFLVRTDGPTTRRKAPTRSAEGFSSVGCKMNKGNFLVQNKNLPLEDWKRRKRDIETENLHTHPNNKRRKRSWYWPSLSFLHENSQIVKDADFEHNESPQSSLKIYNDRRSFIEDDDEVRGGERDFDDFGDDPLGYERRKREIDSRQFNLPGKYQYYYPNRNTRSSLLPLSRNRRYIRRKMGEPQQQLLTEISDAELFGALPQSYTGELTRYKRVKRTDAVADES